MDWGTWHRQLVQPAGRKMLDAGTEEQAGRLKKWGGGGGGFSGGVAMNATTDQLTPAQRSQSIQEGQPVGARQENSILPNTHID